MVVWDATAKGFSLELDYDGHTVVDGEFREKHVGVRITEIGRPAQERGHVLQGLLHLGPGRGDEQGLAHGVQLRTRRLAC